MNTEVLKRIKVRSLVVGAIGAGGLIQQIFISDSPSLEIMIVCFLLFWSPGAMAIISLRVLGGSQDEPMTGQSSPSLPSSESSPSSSQSQGVQGGSSGS